jgi:hypothetical protein
MIGLKIQGKWLSLILEPEISKKKTMEVRSIRRLCTIGKEIALGNSDTGLIEGYAEVSEIVTIPYKDIPNYESEHKATSWLMERYKGKKFVYGYILTMARINRNPKPYPKNPSIWFKT